MQGRLIQKMGVSGGLKRNKKTRGVMGVSIMIYSLYIKRAAQTASYVHQVRLISPLRANHVLAPIPKCFNVVPPTHLHIDVDPNVTVAKIEAIAPPFTVYATSVESF
jgi:hypothetical protein